MIIFAYNFPHRKTEDFILQCCLNNIKIDAIIGAGWKELKVTNLPFKTKVNVLPKFSPKQLASYFNIPFFEYDHESADCIKLLEKIKPAIGLITGARILPAEVINKFEKGIINFHPGDIPEIRGLNSSLRAIKLNKPQTVTAHLIDCKIDLGKILFKVKIKVDKNDTIFDINERLYYTQLTMLNHAIYLVKNNLGQTVSYETPYYSKAPFGSLEEFEKTFKNYNP